MALKSGSSHAMVALGSLLFTELVIRYFEPTFPVAIKLLEVAAVQLGGCLRSNFGLLLDTASLVRLLVAVGLAFAWGAIYHWSRFGAD